MKPSCRAPSGFTIIEVMVSIMILAVSLVAVFGAQFSAVATVGFSRYTTQAMQLARCRMSEIELEILVLNGFEEANVESSGECCEVSGGDTEEFSCSWKIERMEVPDMATLMAGSADGGVGDSLLDDAMGGTGGADTEDMGMLSMVSSFMPALSNILEQAIRRVTVSVEWKQGSRERTLELSQFLVHPTQGPLKLMNAAADAADMAETIEDRVGGDTSSSRSPSSRKGEK
jgi:prepilin-type N-terminal cleavage/methylation domain-containing protein